MRGADQEEVLRPKRLRERRTKRANPLTRSQRVRVAKKIITENRTVVAEPSVDVEGSIHNMLDWLEWRIKGERWFRYAGSKEGILDRRRVLNWLRRGTVVLRNLKMWPPGLEKFRADVEHWVAVYEAELKRPARKPKPSAIDKQLAAEAAVHLCDEFGIEPSTTKAGPYCRLTAVLYGDEQADLQKQCQRVLSGDWSTFFTRNSAKPGR
jgi:hypothetical protein